jgi:hypothetical protein
LVVGQGKPQKNIRVGGALQYHQVRIKVGQKLLNYLLSVHGREFNGFRRQHTIEDRGYVHRFSPSGGTIESLKLEWILSVYYII